MPGSYCWIGYSTNHSSRSSISRVDTPLVYPLHSAPLIQRFLFNTGSFSTSSVPLVLWHIDVGFRPFLGNGTTFPLPIPSARDPPNDLQRVFLSHPIQSSRRCSCLRQHPERKDQARDPTLSHQQAHLPGDQESAQKHQHLLR